MNQIKTNLLIIFPWDQQETYGFLVISGSVKSN